MLFWTCFFWLDATAVQVAAAMHFFPPASPPEVSSSLKVQSFIYFVGFFAISILFCF
jgi:hypothetical protein